MHDFEVYWLSEAVQEKDAAVDFIGEHNLLAALAVDGAISQQVGQLADFPYLGKKGRIVGTFELVISSTPFIVSYRLHGREVQILHLFHSRRDWPPKSS